MTTESGASLGRRGVFANEMELLLFGGFGFTTTSSGLEPSKFGVTSSAGLSGVWNNAIELSRSGNFDRSNLQSAQVAPQISGPWTSSQQVMQLREISGLTIDQIGRLFGVSRRSVHNWINGKTMAPRHEERLSAVLKIVKALPGSTPREKRSLLLAAREGGSVFQKLLSARIEDATIQVAAIKPSELLQL